MQQREVVFSPYCSRANACRRLLAPSGRNGVNGVQEVIALGLPQWLPLTDAEEMIAQHLAAGQEAADKEAVAAGSVGDVCNVPFSSSPASSNRSAVPELELDLDCWRVSFGLA